MIVSLSVACQGRLLAATKMLIDTYDGKGTPMLNRTFADFAASAFCASTAAFAANPACDTQAAEKKLAGAAKASFVKKCEKDAAEAATKTCEVQAVDKKLAGAAKNSYVKKCVTDATAAAK
jgi:hypothetical protein